MIKGFFLGAILLVAPLICLHAEGDQAAKPKSSEEERQEFLRKFAKDPNAIKPAEPETPESSDSIEQKDSQKLESLIKNFQAHKKEPSQNESPSPSGTESGEDGDEVKVTSTIDLEHLKKLQEMGGGGIDVPGLLKKLQAAGAGGGKDAQKNAKGNADYSLMIYQILHVFRAQKEADVANFFRLKMEKGPLSPFFNFIPGAQKVPYLLARVVRDEKALPEVAKVASERKKLLHYAAFVFMTFIISYGIKRFTQKHDESIFTGISSGIFRNLIIMLVRLTAFFVLFSKEFTPLWQVIKLAF